MERATAYAKSSRKQLDELTKRVQGISAKMLTERLRTLEGAALVRRDYEATIPGRWTTIPA